MTGSEHTTWSDHSRSTCPALGGTGRYFVPDGTRHDDSAKDSRKEREQLDAGQGDP